jgi:molybdenum cofactor cytidylyltransferase
MSRKIAIVILAAGESKRMGQPKQLLAWGTDTLVNHVIKTVKKVASAGHYLVLGANHSPIATQLSPGIKVLINENWKLGIGSSIAFAIQSLKDHYDAVQFVLVDQPKVDAMFLTYMQHSYLYKNHKLISSKYEDSIGIPALFDKKYYPDLESLSSQGAKSVIAKFESELYAIKPPAYFEDLDTMEQYTEMYLHSFGKPPL